MIMNDYELLGKRWLAGEVDIETFNGIKLNEKQKAFVNAKERMVLANGGFACLHGDSKVWNDDLKIYQKIKDIKSSFTVLSLFNGNLIPMKGLAPVKKGRTKLLKIVTQHSTFKGHPKHVVLTSSGYKTLDTLLLSDRLVSSCQIHQVSNSGSFLSKSFASVLYWTGKSLSSLFDYLTLRHLCDVQPRLVKDTDQDVSPSQDGVQQCNQSFLRKDDYKHGQGYTHICQSYDLPENCDSNFLVSPLENNEASYTSKQFFVHTLHYIRESWKSLLMFYDRLIALGFFPSYANPTIGIISIQEEKKEEDYYDIHVPFTHNYLAEGVSHHNSGKTTGFIVKLFLLSMFFPGNRILLGRKSRVDVEQATLPDLFDIFPENSYKYKPGPGIIEFPNGSQILIYGLDVMQAGTSQDIKKSIQKIKSLNLGGVFIDQLEEIDYSIIEALTGRLRKDVPLQQMNFTGNPANYWAYDYFKVNPRTGTRLIETGMLDNKANLKPEYLADQMNKPKMYVDKYVYGIWSPDTLVEGTVFGAHFLEDMVVHIAEPIKSFDGINIYSNPTNHDYQIGVDPSIGSEDPCHVCVVDKETGEEVANFSGYVPTNVIVQKTFQLATMYSLKSEPLVIPEVTGVGQAFVEEFKKIYGNIYIREVFNHREQKKTQKIGFFTNFSTKTQLIENMRNLLDKKFPRIKDKKTLDEFRTFIYSDEAAQKGAGAQRGYHDDRVMGKLLAYWNVPYVYIKEDADEAAVNFGLYSQRFN